MCTLSILRGFHEDLPLIVAANRDERKDRPSTPPSLWEGDIRFVAGRDEVAGGTWLGVNERGLVAGLTNRWTGAPPDAERPTRGRIVTRLLGQPSLDEALSLLLAPSFREPNPYLLLLADSSGRAYWWDSDHESGPLRVEGSLFSLGNRRPSEKGDAKPEALGRALEQTRTGMAGQLDLQRWPPLLGRALGTHVGERKPHESPCVHSGPRFGTVSATVMLLTRAPRDRRLWHAPGPPCRTKLVDHSGLMRQLAAPTAAADRSDPGAGSTDRA